MVVEEEDVHAGGEAAKPPVYDAPCRLLDWRQTAREGMLVDLTLRLPGPLGAHPFRMMQAGKELGQRLRVRCLRYDADGESHAVYEGEAILMRWSENDRAGMMVRLLLDDGPDGHTGRHPFFGFSTGRSTGEPLDLQAHAIDDDESELPPSRMKKREPFHTLSEVQQSQILCRDQRFRAFLRANIDRFVQDESARESLLSLQDKPDGFPAAALRNILQIPSRSVMNTDAPEGRRARRIWQRLLTLYLDEVWSQRYRGMDRTDDAD